MRPPHGAWPARAVRPDARGPVSPRPPAPRPERQPPPPSARADALRHATRARQRVELEAARLAERRAGFAKDLTVTRHRAAQSSTAQRLTAEGLTAESNAPRERLQPPLATPADVPSGLGAARDELASGGGRSSSPLGDEPRVQGVERALETRPELAKQPALEAIAAAAAGGDRDAARRVAALVQRIELFVRSGAAALQLTLGGDVGARVGLERRGPGRVAVAVVGARGPVPAELVERLRSELGARGLAVVSLTSR